MHGNQRTWGKHEITRTSRFRKFWKCFVLRSRNLQNTNWNKFQMLICSKAINNEDGNLWISWKKTLESGEVMPWEVISAFLINQKHVSYKSCMPSLLSYSYWEKKTSWKMATQWTGCMDSFQNISSLFAPKINNNSAV